MYDNIRLRLSRRLLLSKLPSSSSSSPLPITPLLGRDGHNVSQAASPASLRPGKCYGHTAESRRPSLAVYPSTTPPHCFPPKPPTPQTATQRRSFATQPTPPVQPLHPRFALMATTGDAVDRAPKEFPAMPSLESLHEQLRALSITDQVPVFPDSNPTTNPVDIFRCVIAHHLAPITGVDIKLVYPALEWTQTLDKGDLVLAVPRLRVKGNPAELGKQWVEKVAPPPPSLAMDKTNVDSSRIARSSSDLKRTAHFCVFTSRIACSTRWC
jgi:hypothetical protein